MPSTYLSYRVFIAQAFGSKFKSVWDQNCILNTNCIWARNDFWTRKRILKRKVILNQKCTLNQKYILDHKPILLVCTRISFWTRIPFWINVFNMYQKSILNQNFQNVSEILFVPVIHFISEIHFASEIYFGSKIQFALTPCKSQKSLEMHFKVKLQPWCSFSCQHLRFKVAQGTE